MKNIFLTRLLINLFLLITSCSGLGEKMKSEKINWINFEWQGNYIGDRYFDKLAIFIPFSIEGIPHNFKSQFDLGATSTMLYGNAILPYLEEYPYLAKKISNDNEFTFVKNVDIKLDDVSFLNRDLAYCKNFGDVLTKDSLKTDVVRKIGTIGADLFQNKLLIIDFINKKIASVDSLPDSYQKKTNFVNAKLDNGRIKVPVNINEDTYDFMFDTGSSMLPLAVAMANQSLICGNEAITDTLTASSWGNDITIYGAKINSNIQIGNYKIDITNFMAYGNDDFNDFFEQEKILGIMGNSFFFDKIIVVDFKNKQFGIVENDKN